MYRSGSSYHDVTILFHGMCADLRGTPSNASAPRNFCDHRRSIDYQVCDFNGNFCIDAGIIQCLKLSINLDVGRLVSEIIYVWVIIGSNSSSGNR